MTDPARSDPDRRIRTAMVAITVVAGLVLFFYAIRTILIPFVFGAVIAYICAPLVEWLVRRTRAPRWACAIAVLLAILGLATLVGFLGVPPLMHQMVRVTGDLQGSIQQFITHLIGDGSVTMLGQQINAATAAGYIVDALRGWFNSSGSVLTLLELLIGGIFGFILSWVLLGYFLVSTPQIADGVFWLVPPGSRPMVHRIWQDLDPILRRYFVGILLVVLYAAVAAYIGLGLLLNLDHAVFLALLTGLLEVIPVVGPAASAILAGLVAVQDANTSWNIIYYVIYITILRVSIDEFVGPIVLGKAAYVRPVVVIFCFLTGGILFGVVGIVLAVPAALAIKVTLAHAYGEPGSITRESD